MNSKQFRWMAMIVGLLVIVNIVLVATIWMRKEESEKPAAPRGGDARSLLIKELNLTSDQQKKFDSLRRMHFDEIGEYRQEMRHLKDDFFSRLETNEPGEPVARTIGEVQSKIEMSTFNHFRAMRNICTKAQQEKFDDIIQDVLRNMAPRPGGAGGPPPPGGDDHHPPPPPDH